MCKNAKSFLRKMIEYDDWNDMFKDAYEVSIYTPNLVKPNTTRLMRAKYGRQNLEVKIINAGIDYNDKPGTVVQAAFDNMIINEFSLPNFTMYLPAELAYLLENQPYNYENV